MKYCVKNVRFLNILWKVKRYTFRSLKCSGLDYISYLSAICVSGIIDLGSCQEMWSHTRLFLLASTLALLIGHHVTRSQRPRLGGAINVFSRYGYLSISMRVVPRNDTETWIFREPTLDIFKNVTPLPSKQRGAKANTAVFDGDFHMEFCDNIR